MLIVAGHYVVDPADQTALVAARVDAMKATRAEPGCLEYVISADPVDPSRVMIFERWADQASFEAHVAGLANRPRSTSPATEGVEIKIFDIAGERSLG